MIKGVFLNSVKWDLPMERNAAAWYPTVFPDKCNGCEGLEAAKCIQFCPHDVFEIRNEKAVVVKPQNCVYGCIACESVCPKKAITFPQRVALTPKAKPKDKGLLHKVKCRKCENIFWTNRDTDLCFECEAAEIGEKRK